MEPEGRAGGDERAARLAQVEAMRARGDDPYPVRFDRTHTLAEVREQWDDRVETGTTSDDLVTVAGRVVSRRDQGKLVFAGLRDGTGTIQLFVNKSELGDDAFARFVDDVERGDWVGVEGAVMKTKKGELSVNVKTFTLLSKSLRPLPEKWHGLSDTDTRFRQRYVDLIANDEARRVFAVRFAAIAAARRFLTDRGFVEVETPVLTVHPGSDAARPFTTHHNALDTDFSLRIAPELFLKRLVVGGMDRVFEIARVFRNEGVSTRHNPEFTMLELYEAFSDYTDMMRLTEELIAVAARASTGSSVVEWDGRRFDLTPPFLRRPMIDLIKEHAGLSVHPSDPVENLRKVCDDLDIPYEEHWGSGKLVLEIYEKTAESNIEGPTFVCDYPLEVSPLARAHRDDPTLTERFELIIGGREIANAYSELNDPIEQRRRFAGQAALKEKGDAEAQGIDGDYLRALEYGLPPTGGMGMGIDRLVMLLAGVTSIKEVILFPHLRPEVIDERQEDVAMSSERILITGMGGELGTRVAQLIEQRSWAGDVVGVDFVPPRRRLRRAVFHRIDPRDRDKLAQFVEDFAPTVVADFGVYEPASRMSPVSAIERTELCTIVTMSAAARTGKLEYVVVRSGLEVYGPLTVRASVPDEDVMPEPRTPYGRSLLEVESIVAGVRLRQGVPVCALRYAPVVGPHVPSPVGRLLRLPVVPVPAFSDPPFSLLHPDDAAEAMVAAIDRRYDGPLNVVGPGAATPWQAVRLGGRVPLPVVGPFWDVAVRIVELAGAAVAPHVIEQLRHGRTGAGDRVVDALGLSHLVPTQTVLRELFEWADVIPIPTSREAVA